MKKEIVRAYVILFIALFIAPVCIHKLFGGLVDQTNFEKRQAAEKPSFSISAIEEYPQAFEAYFNDNLPYRNQLITINSLLNLHIFKDSSVKKVIIGKNDWLFYNPAGSDGDPIADYCGKNLLSTEELEHLAANLVAVNTTLQSQNKEFVIMIVPNKESMYGELYLPDEFQPKGNFTKAMQVVQYLSEHTDLKVVFPKEDILLAQNNDPDRTYYYKIDTHWNSLGAYIGTKALLSKVGIQIPALDTFEIAVQEKNTGDLAEMLGLADNLKHDNEYVINGHFLGGNVNQFFPVEGNAEIARTSTTSANERSLFMVRDSFALAMIPYLSTKFNECTFIHNIHYLPDMLEQYPSDIVVLEVAERYLWKLGNFQVE